MAIEDILKPEFIWWEDLNEDEKKVIQDKKEYPIFSVVKGMPKNVRKEIYDSMRVKDQFSEIYHHTETGWIDFFETCFCHDNCIDIDEFKELKKKNSPQINEIASKEAYEFLNSGLPEKFKLYFAVKFRDEMEFVHSSDKREAFFFQTYYHLKK